LHSLDRPDAATLAALHRERDEPPRVETARRERPLDRVVLVVLDGVGERALLPPVEAGAVGPVAAIVRVHTGLPSLSRPGYHVIFTGVPQDVSGLRTNFEGHARADSLADRVHERGGSVAFLQESVPWFGDFFASSGDLVAGGPWAGGRDVFDRAFASEAALIVVHLTGADAVGHAVGAAHPTYPAMVRRQLDIVKSHVEAVRPSPAAARTHWLIGADHGHVPRGGHGGPEPAVAEVAWVLLAAGADAGAHFVTPSERLPATAIAPWAAQLLGVPAPLEALSAAPRLGLPASTEPAPANETGGFHLIARQRAVADALEKGRTQAHRLVVVTTIAASLVLLILGSLWRPRRRLVALLPTAAAIALFLLAGPGVTFSGIRHERVFFQEAVSILALGAALVWPLAARWGASLRASILLSALPPMIAFVAVWGELGTAFLGPRATMLLPSSGLVPPGVLVGVLAAEGVRRVVTYLYQCAAAAAVRKPGAAEA
jgi:hypothetical protein